MTAIRIDVNASDALASLGRAAARLADPALMLDEIGGRLEASTRQRFEVGVGPDDVPWKPSLRAQEHGGQTLVDTARLRNSITHVVNGSELLVGTNVIYAAIHQFGGRAGRDRSVELPARPYLGISGDDERAIDRIVLSYLERAFA